MYQLVYESVADVEFSPLILTNIIDVSISNNSAVGVTGLLTLDEDRFIQVLEGPRDAVLGIMRRIERDRRHNEIVILFQGEVAERSFSEWSMAFAQEGGEPAARLATRVRSAMNGTNQAVSDHFDRWVERGSARG